MAQVHVRLRKSNGWASFFGSIEDFHEEFGSGAQQKSNLLIFWNARIFKLIRRLETILGNIDIVWNFNSECSEQKW